jgi:SM-20-related protein
LLSRGLPIIPRNRHQEVDELRAAAPGRATPAIRGAGLGTSSATVIIQTGQAAQEGGLASSAEAEDRTELQMLDLAALRRTPLVNDPYPFVVVPGFLTPAARAGLAADFPRIDQPGSFPVADLRFGPAFRSFIDELESDAMRRAFAGKFGLDLTGRPTMVTVRGQARASDGRIHVDTPSKLITVLIYMNEDWEAPGGRLRMLRTPDLADVITEVPPAAGTLLAFLVTPHSWHGHAPASGPRRVVQLNWVTSADVVRRERLRHGLSARLKRLFSTRARAAAEPVQ